MLRKMKAKLVMFEFDYRSILNRFDINLAFEYLIFRLDNSSCIKYHSMDDMRVKMMRIPRTWSKCYKPPLVNVR